MRGVGGFYFYRFEHDELRKEQRLGRHALDGDDIKWIMSAENRKVACMDLLAKNNQLGLLDQLKHWWSGN
jgi:hypothetical protein